MKRLILMMSFIVVAMIATAQSVTLSPMPLANTFQGVTTDYTLTNTTARTFIMEAAKQQPATQDFYVQLDSLAGNHTNVSVALYGAKFSDTAYSQIGSTVNWKGTTADTTIVISNATANRYNYYKWVLTGTGTGTTTIVTQKLKLYLE